MRNTPMLVLAGLLASSCASSSAPPGAAGQQDPALRGLSPARPPNTSTDGRPLAIIDGEAANTAVVEARLRETAGAVVLDELALDSVIEKEFVAGGLRLPADAASSERSLLLSTVASDATVDASQAAALIERFRRARGLGPSRFEALLIRNAKLRALVRQAGLVTPGDIDSAIAAELSATVLARILVTAGHQEAADALATLSDLPAGAQRSAKFAELAYRVSRDPSAPRGGLFGPVSPQDPNVPSLVRSALAGGIGSLSQVLAIDTGFAVVLVESESPAKPMPQGSELERLRERVRIRKEREAMDRLTSRLQSETKVSPIDDSLRWSWDNRPTR